MLSIHDGAYMCVCVYLSLNSINTFNSAWFLDR